MRSQPRYITTADIVKRDQKQSRLSYVTSKTQPNNQNLSTRNIKSYSTKKNYTNDVSNRINKMLTTCTAMGTTHKIPYTQEDQQQKDEQYQFTKEYLSQLQKAKNHKTSLYTSFRHKLVSKFPEMRKVYPDQQFQSLPILPLESRISQQQNQADIRGTQNNNDLKKNSLGLTNHISSTIGMSKNSKQLNTVNKHNKNIMKEILKVCYFYSKSKKCCISTNYKSQSQQYIPPPTPKPAKFNYILFKKQKNRFKRNPKSKGAHLLISQNEILSLEKQGTKAYKQLKKCYDDAVENALLEK